MCPIEKGTSLSSEAFILEDMSTPSTTRTTQRLTLVTLVILALALVGFIVYRQVAPQGSATTPASGDIDVSGQPMLGQEDAPVEIAVFEDFKCPACRFFDENVFPEVKRELIDTGQARIYFLNYPFIGPDSTTAAIAGECVYNENPEAFWDYKTYVFRSQGDESEAWATPAVLADIARNNLSGLDADALQSCTADKTYAEQVSTEKAMGDAAGVQGTPSIFVDGQRLESFEFSAVQTAVKNAQAD